MLDENLVFFENKNVTNPHWSSQVAEYGLDMIRSSNPSS